jgi:hypothetical protein
MRAGAMTSIALFGFKLAHFQLIKIKAEEKERLEHERAGVILALEEALSPELAP